MRIDLYRRSSDWIATVEGNRARWEAGKDPEEAIRKLQASFPALKGKEIIYRGKDLDAQAGEILHGR